jgi:hypothetical protein
VNNDKRDKSWQHRCEVKDVVTIGIHAPETSGERDIERIEAQAAENGLKKQPDRASICCRNTML